MRIISGSSKGKKLFTPKQTSLRPTSDRVKESLFNILGEEISGKAVLDLFAGTGNLGIEALSRGARRVTFVENTREAYRLIERNLLSCQMGDRSEILLKEVDRGLRLLHAKGECFDLIFMDPPYEKGLIRKTMEILGTMKIYHEDSILVIEHNRREPLPDLSGSWSLIRQRKIGDTMISFLTPITRHPL
jgi:16S rRNA (guanine966-N2)-methyltransferase